MRTITLKLFRFEELSKEAQEVAKKNVEFEQFDSEMGESAWAAQRLYDMLIFENRVSGNRLRTWIVNNILPELTSTKYYGIGYGKNAKFRFSKIFTEVDEGHLTGLCFDYDFLKPLMDFVKKPDENVHNFELGRTDLDKIAQELLDAERDYFYSDEGFSEHCEDKSMEFLQNGAPFNDFVKDCAVISF